MIMDDIRQAHHYSCLGSLFQDAFDFLSKSDLLALSDGKFALQDNRLFAIIATYDTLPLANFIQMEGHKRYADIQFMVSGREMLAWKPAHRIPDKGIYDPENDVWKSLFAKEQLSFFRLSAGEFAILFPWDAHAPMLQDGVPRRVKKIVIKVAMY